MSFRIRGLDPEPFQPLYGLPTEELAKHAAIRYIADKKPGCPDRIEMRDAEPGESLLLVNCMHLPVDSPYRSCHAIYVLEGAVQAYDAVGQVPDQLRTRVLSVRAFDGAGMMTDADLVDGMDVEAVVERMFKDEGVDYLHIHYAKRGCYAGLVERG